MRYPIPFRATFLADGDDTASVIVWSFILIALLIVGFLGAMYVKKWVREDDEAPDDSAGFTLGDLRRLHQRGKLSAEEFEKARALMIFATQRAAERAAQAAAEAAKQQGRPAATDIEALRARAKRGAGASELDPSAGLSSDPPHEPPPSTD